MTPPNDEADEVVPVTDADWDAQLDAATQAWREWCATLADTGAEALRNTLTYDEVDLAEGVRHLARMVRLTSFSGFENNDGGDPYLWRALGPDLKMGGDNPQGLYLSCPIDGADTFRLHGTRGSAIWVSVIVGRSPSARAAGLAPFGEAVFSTDLVVADDGTFELWASRERPDGVANWVPTDEHSNRLLVRQFFGTPETVTPMDLRIENVTRPSYPRPALTVDEAITALRVAGGTFGAMVPMFQGELVGKGGARINSFATDIGDPTSTSGGVPGGNAVTARWHLEPDEALLVQVTPPDPCPYWDVQVGNGWYESFDYRWFFSGLTCAQAEYEDDGSFMLVVSERDPGVANWLETAHHRDGHIAIRWQLTDTLPIPECTVVPADEVAARTGLPRVAPAARAAQRRALREAFDRRFRP
jgi:hypothetical protein